MTFSLSFCSYCLQKVKGLQGIKGKRVTGHVCVDVLLVKADISICHNTHRQFILKVKHLLLDAISDGENAAIKMSDDL